MRALAITLVSVLAVACGDDASTPTDASGDAGGDGPVATACATCRLFALHPAVARAGETVTLEGTFEPMVEVTFPGGIVRAATVLGAHRATVVVPDGATADELTITTTTGTVGQPFRRATFGLGVQRFQASYDQAGGARHTPSLTVGRWGAASVVVGSWLYVVGGTDPSGQSLASVERARIHADGTLGGFALVAGATLAVERTDPTALVVGDALYVIGGRNSTGSIASVERAAVAADGTLGAFTTGPSLAGARYGHTTVVAGSSLYVIGGNLRAVSTDDLATVERAAIAADGSVGPFALVAGVTLGTARSGHATAVVGNRVYVLGGSTNAVATTTVESATLDGDGVLGAFSAVGGTSLTAARASAVELGGALYVLGGATVSRAPIVAGGALGAFAAAGTPTVARDGAAPAILGNYLYLVGGGNGAVSETIERATINATGASGTLAASTLTLTPGRDNQVSVVVGDNLYLIGGYGGGYLGSVERARIDGDGAIQAIAIDPTTALVTPREAAVAAVIGPYVYVIGGHDNNSYIGSVERATIGADGSLGTFSTVTGVTLTTPRGGHTAVVVGDQLYVIGGFATGTPSYLATIERATIGSDGSLGTFSVVGSLPSAHAGHGAAVIGDAVYILGGIGNLGSTVDTIERAPIAGGVVGAFTTVSGATLPAPRYTFATQMIGDSLYLLGGRSSSAPETVIARATVGASGALGAFADVSATLATARRGHTSAVLGNYLYAFGGYGPSNVELGTVEQTTLP